MPMGVGSAAGTGAQKMGANGQHLLLQNKKIYRLLAW
jgi:hypothetical protein